MSKNKIIATIRDSRKRPLVILLRTKNKTIMHVFKRYKDMTVSDREFILDSYRKVATSGAGRIVEKQSEAEIIDFLDFKDDHPCG